MKYRINQYMTLKGKVRKVTLPDSTYGEWIVYENNTPKYHVNIFNNLSKSDCLIFAILNESQLEFKDILTDINIRYSKNLSLSSKAIFGIKINSEITDYTLNSLPTEWIAHFATHKTTLGKIS